MIAPLLLVWGAPALRTLARHRARALARLLRSRPASVVTHPAVAACLDTGGMWVLYRTDLYAAAAARPALLALVHIHMLAAGYLFAFSIAGPDPAPHRAPLAVRAAVLVAAVAAHDVLAKLLYAGRRPGRRRAPRPPRSSCTTAPRRCTSPCSCCSAGSGRPGSGAPGGAWGP
jgi:putative membrane protein